MNVAPAMTQTEPRVVLTARGLGKDFAGFTAVNNVDLDVEHARIHALIGPNGAGKTTLINVIDHLGLTPYRDHRAADLSYGRKRVLEIATTLALDPEVLLLDEPMAGMGQEDVRMVAEIIRDVARTRAVLMVEHNLTVVADICHHVTVLQRGEIIATGDYASVSADPRVRTAYMGTEA